MPEPDLLNESVDPVLTAPDGRRVRVSSLLCADRAWTSLAPTHTWQHLPPYRCILCGTPKPKENPHARHE